MKPRPQPPESPFASLAVELVELIAGHLEADGLLELRLTCRDLQKKTFHQFARRFFSSIKTDLSEESLGRIDSLSRHEELKPYVHGLAFMLQNGVGRGLVWDRHPWGPLSAPLQIEAIGRLRDNLVTKFTNCRSFFIFCRYPEGHPDMNRVTISDAVAVFFAIVVDAQLPVSSFHLIYANKYSRTLVMDMRRMPKLLYRQPAFKMVWTNLRKLSLEQYLTLDNFGFLLELVLSAPNLQTLLLKKLLHGLRGNLTALTLYHVSLTPDEDWMSVLKELGQSCGSLQSISLYYLWATAPTKELLSFPDIHKAPELCGKPKQRLNMVYSENPQSPTVLGIEYSGSNMPDVLRLLQATA
jgi:hypothetical protein